MNRWWNLTLLAGLLALPGASAALWDDTPLQGVAPDTVRPCVLLDCHAIQNTSCDPVMWTDGPANATSFNPLLGYVGHDIESCIEATTTMVWYQAFFLPP